MDVEVIRQPSRVKEVNGDVVIASPTGEARKALVGENINIGEMIITAKGGTLILEDLSETLFIDENCVSCIEPGDGFGWATAPVSGDIQVDDTLLGEGALSGDELAAIQEAILAGADPTAILEATAAGAGVSGSANGGFITIAYNNPEVLASTFFETAGFNAQVQSETQDTGRRFQFAQGGESTATTLPEGSLSLGTYPATIVSSTLITAGDLALDPESFVPESLSVAALLTELNSDITSNGEDVLFSYNDSQNAIIGVNEQGEVLRIEIDATSVGRDVVLEVTTTLSQPIDHLPSVAGGSVAYNDDQITINVEIQGADASGNLLRSPISVSSVISDGEEAILAPIDGQTALESSLATGTEAGSGGAIVSGTIAGQLGSDQVVDVRLDVEAFNLSQQASGLTSSGQIVTLEANPLQPGGYVGFVLQGAERVDVFSLTIEGVSNLSSGGFEAAYQFELLAPLDHSEQGKDDVLVSLPVFAIDADNDTTANSNLVITVVDDVPLISDAEIAVIEPDAPYGNESQPITLISASGAEQGVVTQFTFDGGDPITLVDGQTEYLVTDGKVILSADGTLSFAPDRNIDHSTNEVVSHTLVATIEDGDGDVLTSTVAIDITDGNDPVITQIETAQVSESGLTGGTQAGQAAVQDSGQITIDIGSDDIAALTLDITRFTEQSTLKAQGQTVRLIEDPDVSGQYQGVIKVDGQDVPVFEVTLDQTTLQDYTFTLLRPLDHSGDNDDSLVIHLPVIAVDSDGDDSASVDLAITVNDDIQTVMDGKIAVTEPDTQYDNESQPITLISASGAEQGVVTQFTFDGGDPITLVDGQTEYLVTDGKVILSADGTLSFAPDRNIDHSTNEVVSHTLVATIEDGDGDVLTSRVAIDITDGNDPLITKIETAQVSESGLTGGTQAGQAAVQDSGQITIDIGSDDIAALTLDITRFTEQSTLKAQGQTVRLIEDSDVPGQYQGVITVDGQEVPVFEISLNQTTLEDYTFTLLRPLDHSGDNDESLVIHLPVVAEDSDGDESASVNLAITVNDDIQTVLDGKIAVTEPDTQYDNESQPITLISASGAEQGVVTQFTFDGGDPITLVDGQTEYLVTDGKVILSADGTLSFAPDRNIDHSTNEVVSHTLVATIEDGDGDVLTSRVAIDITDGNDPLITKIETAQVSESGLTGGTQAGQAAVQDSGTITIDVGSDDITALTLDITSFTEQSTLQAQGQTVRLIEDSDVPGQYKGVITVDGQEVPVFEISLNQTTLQDYTFTLLRPLDHSGDNDESLVIHLPVVAVDSDGDESASVNLAITVNDDIQTVMDGKIAVTESDTQYDNESQPITLISASGAEQGVVTQFTFDGGDPITLVDGQTEYLVTDGKVILSADGTLSFAPDRNIDHSTSDVVSHTLVATIEDGDGDVLTSTVTIAIKDGNLPVITQVSGGSVFEAGLSSGSGGENTNLDVRGTVTITTGSDDIAKLAFDLEQFNDLNSEGLYSSGQRILVEEKSAEPGSYLGYIELDGDKLPIFELNLGQPSLSDYHFTLLANIDHTEQGRDSQTIALPIVAIDADGDASLSADIEISVTDDIASIDGLSDASEWNVEEANIEGSGALVEGQLEYTPGADGVVSFALSNLSQTQSGLTSGGTPVVIQLIESADGTTSYQGVANQQPVFTLVLGDDGSYRYQQLRALDHAEDSDVLTIPFEVVAVDGDGDRSSAFRLGINVADDTPTLSGWSGDNAVDEDDIESIGSDQSDSSRVTGQLAVDDGVDGVTEYRLMDADAILASVRSGEDDLVWQDVVNTGSKWTYTAVTATNATPVFQMTFDTQDDSYAFELLGPIDHPVATSEDDVTLYFTVAAVDYDHDASNIVTLPIVITDDVPTLADQSITKVEGSGFGTTSNFFDQMTDQGADSAELTRLEGGVSGDGNPIVFRVSANTYESAIELSSGQQTVRVFEQLGGDDAPRQLGVLRINSDGSVQFKANGYLDHDGDDITFSVYAIATDGDNDIDQATLDVTITDRNARTINLNVTTFEDAGRDASIVYAAGDEPERENTYDNQSELDNAPAKLSVQVNLYDVDNDESIGALTIIGGNYAGTFYYQDSTGVFHAIKQDTDGKLRLDGSELVQSQAQDGNNVIATIDNLYFVPDRNLATNGNMTVRYSLDILNGTEIDHSVSGRIRIDVQSVADIAVWDEANSIDHYEVLEDDRNVTLTLHAQTQDTSAPETITYELRAVTGDFELLDKDGQPLTVNSDGVYLVSSSDINSIQIDPAEHFSGQIQLSVVAISEEEVNPYIDGSVDKSTARSEAKTITIDVAPYADTGTLKVSRIRINEDNIADPDDTDLQGNRDPLTLDEVIEMLPSADSDGSEALFVRIANITQGASLVWAGTGDSPIVEINVDGVTYQEIPYAVISQVEVVPAAHSNEDFRFEVTGVVRDSASLSDDATLNATHDAYIGPKVVNVEVKGVADVPILNDEFDSGWVAVTDNGQMRIETTIEESQNARNFAQLDFEVLSGEKAQALTDNSETLSVILSNIPEGVVIEDTDGNVIDLNFIGYVGGQPSYEANITGAINDSGIVIRPVDSSTQNIDITATIVVTENDGHSLSFDTDIRVNVAPVIDASEQYTNRSVGNEDSAINIDWHPKGSDYIDSDEHFTSITISGIPSGAIINVNNPDVSVDVTQDTNGVSTLVITPNELSHEAFTQVALDADFIQITPSKDTSTNFTLSTSVEIEERDVEYTSDDIVGEGGRVSATLTGSIDVVVRPVVEPQDENNGLRLTNEQGVVFEPLTLGINGQLNYVPIVATSGAITFTTNQDNPALNGEVIISYQETDNSSVELVSQVVLELSYVPDPNNPLSDLTLPDSVLDQLLVTGAAYEGNGRWVITDESNFSVKAPEGLNFGDIDLTGTNELQMTLHTQVVDPGDLDANGNLLEPNESSVGGQRSTSVVIAFDKQIIPGDEVAADITITEDQIVTAQEDTVVNLGQQMATLSVLSLSGAIDGSPDEVTLVFEPNVEIGGVLYPITIQGGDVDFVNGKFVYQTHYNDGALGSIDGLSLVLPKDYSGDFLLPFTVISKDTTSGDENVASASVIVQVAPVADVESGNSAKPSFSIDVLGSLDDDMSAIDADNNGQSDAIGYEDSYIQLAVTHVIADQLNGETEGGQETLNQVTLTLADSNVGAFYQVVDDGTGGQVYQWVGTSVSFDQQAIDEGTLNTLLFKPALNYPSADGNNQVVVNISGEVVDRAIFNQPPSTGEASDSQTFTTSVSFEVVPVVDDVIVSGPGNSADTIEIEGNEDELIALSASGPIDIALTDDDGSEQFVSIKLTGVPEGFLLLADADSDYSVKNNGDGVWSVRLPSAQMTHVDLSGISLQAPKDFSGTVEFNLTAFTQESLLGVPTEVTAPLPKFVVTVNPIGDDIDLDSTDRIEGLEGDNIDIEVDASVIDNVFSASSISGVNENGPETLRVTVTDVPEGASIYYPDGVTLAQYDDATLTWVLNIDAQHLDKIVFNSGDRNSDSQSVTAIDKPLTIKVQSVDSDAQGVEVLGTPAEFSVMLLIDAVNDQPRFVNVVDVDTLEDTSVALNTLQIDDIDTALDDPDAMYHLTLSVDKGSLLVLSDAELVYGLTAVQGSDGQWILEGTQANINAALAASAIVYQPADNANDLNSGGPALVTAEVNDLGNFGLVDDTDESTSQSAKTSFAIRVSEVNDQPVAASLDLGTMSEEGSIVISAQSLIDASSDIDGDTLKVINLQLMEGEGSLIASSDGLSWTFTAGENYSGPVRFSYTIEDNGQTQGSDDFLQDTAELQLHVQGVSDIPTLSIAPENEAIRHITASQSVSNQGIALLGIVAALTDSSEELSLLVEGVPEGAILSSDSGTVVNESGDWYASADAINSLQIHNVSLGEHSLTLTAVSTEVDEGMGIDSAFSEPINLSLTVVEDTSDIDGSSQTRPQWIIAGDQDTQLVGGSGDDIIVSGLGSDILTGGPGMDTFVWKSIEDGAADTVTDLNIAEGDRIDLRELLPELKASQVDMDVLLSHINARLVDDDDIELEIQPEGENGARQTVTLKDLGQQISFAEMDSSQIVSTLLERNVIMHD
ncbi:retention module-containing protein [Vibrio cholerae]